jgi:hypothetical protein
MQNWTNEAVTIGIKGVGTWRTVSRKAGGAFLGTGRFWERTWVSRCYTIPVAPAAAAKTEGVNGALQPVAKHGSRPCAQFSDDKVVRILQHLDLV